MTMDSDVTAPSGFWLEGDDYWAASVCRRGHVQASTLTEVPAAAARRCPDCGATELTACVRCGVRIRGTSRQLVVMPGTRVARGYVPSNCCDGCGAPHPWAPREVLLFELENLLDEEGIDEADRLVVSADLQRLRDLEPDSDAGQERKLWAGVKRRAPQLFAGPGKLILEKVIDMATRKALGMEP